MDLRVFMMGV